MAGVQMDTVVTTVEAMKMSEGHPLRCTFKDNVLSITLDAETLKCATENHPTWSGLDSAYVVEDEKVYAAEVVTSLNSEREDGSTLVTDMIDAAIEHAIENGCEGIKYD